MTKGRQLAFRVHGMCCAEEIAALKQSVGPLVGGDEHLSFHLVTGKLTVDGAAAASSAVVQAIREAGLEAVPWTDDRSAAEPSFWQRRGRAILASASGGMALLGLLFEAWSRGGMLTALVASEAGLEALSPLTMAAYLLSVLAGGWHVAPKALRAARALRPDMNLLMSIAVLGALAIGQWFEAATVMFLFALALLLEGWSVGRARRAIEALLDLSPETARYRTEEGEILEAAVAEVPIGAIVLVRPGERLPLDGVVVAGETSIDQSPITGESMPVHKGSGDLAFAGTVNGDGAFEMQSTKAASQTTLARILELVEEAQSRRAASEQWVDRFARRYTPAVLGLAVAVAIAPPLFFGQGWGPWFYDALVLLVIACPCALVISTPVSIVAGIASAARAGVLIKGGAFLESPANWRVVAFDKTGTLTRGRPALQRIAPLFGHSERDLVERAAALEAESTHPLARAIVGAARSRGWSVEPASSLVAVPGQGAEGLIDGTRSWIGSRRMFEDRAPNHRAPNHGAPDHGGVRPDERSATQEALGLAGEFEDAGLTVIVIWNENHICGLLGLADEPRSEAREAVESLLAAGVRRIVLLTGDNQRTARALAAQVGIEEVRADLLPEDKVSAVRELQQAAGGVAMVGDGVNDAPALATSNCGVAMGAAGADAALETADIALLSDDLLRLPWLVRHSRRTLRVVRQNIGFALAVKAVFVILAVSGVATLWMAIAADMGASLLVISNGLRLLRRTA